MHSEFYKNPFSIFFQKKIFALITFIYCGILLMVGCSQKITSTENDPSSSKHCADSAIAYRQVLIPGIQKTDMDGNIIEAGSVQYRIYFFSVGENAIDSIKIGNTGITTFTTKPVSEKPLYWGAKKEVVLVDKTDCFVQEITTTYNIQDPAGEDKEREIILYYSNSKAADKITIKRSTALPQAVVE